jgi:hypothetical protein
LDKKIYIALVIRFISVYGPKDSDISGPVLGSDSENFFPLFFQKFLNTHNLLLLVLPENVAQWPDWFFASLPFWPS